LLVTCGALQAFAQQRTVGIAWPGHVSEGLPSTNVWLCGQTQSVSRERQEPTSLCCAHLQFIQGPPSGTNPKQQPLVLVSLPHLSIDPQQSRGGTTTFTERWGDFLAGTGPPPAPSPADHTTYGRTGPPAHSQRTSAQEGSGPAAHASCSSPCNSAQQPCAVFSPLLHPFLQQQHVAGGSRGYTGGGDADSCTHGRQSRQGGFCSSSAGATAHAATASCLAQQLNRQFFPALLGGQHGAAGSQQQHWVRPASPDLLSAGKVSDMCGRG
jgi:hypothetical protein